MSCSWCRALITDTGAEEEKRLEKCMRVEVKHCGTVRPDAKREEHVANLTDGGIGEHPFDVALGERAEPRKEQRERADDRHRHLHSGGKRKEDVHACDQVDAGGDHRRRMDQGAHRCRARHRIREPDLKRQLSGFPERSAEKQRRRSHGHAGTLRPLGGRKPEKIADGQRSQLREQQEQPDAERGVADAGHNERLACRTSIVRVFVPEPDEQVAAEAHSFPAEIQQQKVVRKHKDQHRADEKVHVGKEPAEAFVVRHELHGIEMDEEAHEGDHQHHEQRELIQLKCDGRIEPSGVHPDPEGLHVPVIRGGEVTNPNPTISARTADTPTEPTPIHAAEVRESRRPAVARMR